MSKRTLRSTKDKVLVAMNEDPENEPITSDTQSTSSTVAMSDLDTTSGVDCSPAPPTSGMESILATMAKMMADNQRRDDLRQRELELKIAEQESIREDRDRKERREKEDRDRAERQEREDRERAERLDRENRERADRKEKDEREERLKQEEDRRARSEEEKIKKAEEYHQQQMDLMRQMRADEDERQRTYQEQQRRWKERMEGEKAKESRITNALRTFPKISSTVLLPAQLNNYAKLMTGLEASQDVMMARLPEVLTGAPATTFQNMAGTAYDSFSELRAKFLTAAGITFSSAGKAFMKPDIETLKKMSAVDFWCHLRGIIQRMLTGAKTVEEAVSVLSVVFMNVYGSSNLVLSLAGCSQLVDEEIQQALFKTHEAFGSVLGPGGNSDGYVKKKSENRSFKCDNCGRGGHKANECWSKPKPKGIVCFLCNEEGHISSKCPKRVVDNKTESAPKGGSDNKKKWNKNSMVGEPASCSEDENESTMSVLVSGRSLRMLPDSGAQVSVVPPAYVAECEYTGESTCLVDFEGQGDRRRRVALINIKIGDHTFTERVAVSDHLGRSGILSMPIVNESKSSCILSEFYRQKRIEKQSIGAVQTRAETARAKEDDRREREARAEAAADLRDVCIEELGVETDGNLLTGETESEGGEVHESGPNGEDVTVRDVSNGNSVVQTSGPTWEEVTESCVPEVKRVAEHVAGELVNCPTPSLIGERSVLTDGGSMPVSAESSSRPVSAEPTSDQTQLDCLRGGSDRTVLCDLIKSDSTLAACRRLASQRLRGYSWDKGLIIQKYLSETGDEVQRLVVPQSKRRLVCELAHDRMGHLGHRKLREIVGKRFTWPRIGNDLEAYVKSCTACQVATKRGQRRVPLIERPILSEPFEAIAIDIVGPFPMAKGRFRYLLTCVCLATRWPEVTLLRTVTAKAVADGLVSIFSRTGLPYLILCDNGTQFTGKIMGELASTLGIEVKHSSPYHPEANGMVERMHSTLGSMLKKASECQLDWAEQVPFALFALRQMPCRSTGLSPYELVWGSAMRTPLDVLYRGWREKIGESVNVSEWAVKLCDKLEILRDVAVSNAKVESEKRKTNYDRGKCERSYSVGDKVLIRVAGLNGKLADSWEGPYSVEKVLSTVNYKVKLCEGKRTRKVHVNLCKTFHEREKVAGVTILAREEDEMGEGGAVLRGEVNVNVMNDLKVVLSEFEDIMDGEPGVFMGDPLVVKVVEGAEPITNKPYRIPEAVKPKVKEALDALIDRGWVVKSSSPWASPIVPVAKPDGSVRICVNFKKLNEVTLQKQFPIPHFEDVLADVGQACVLSKMDLMKGYHQVPLAEECQDLTGFVTPWGCFKYRVLPFGLKNAPAEFQELMSSVLSECQSFALVYIDDVLVFSKQECDHAGHVRRVLESIRASGLKLNPKKCAWARARVEFLGHVVGKGRVSVPAARVKSLKDFKKPVTRRDLRAALGTFGYYRKFVPGYARIVDVLNQATSTKASHRVRWTPEMDLAFCELKKVICDVCELVVPCEGDGFVLHTDASGRGVGAVLYVCRDGEKLPVAFYSRPVRGAELRYSATELEALAIVQAVNHFVPYLYGRRFEVVTDHAPLCGLMTSSNLNRRLRSFMLKLLEFDFAISYRPGMENLDADGLSRQAWETEEEPGTSGSSLVGAAIVSEGGDVGTPTQAVEKMRGGGGSSPSPQDR